MAGDVELQRSAPRTASAAAQPWILAAIATVASLFFHGYALGLQNQHLQIPHLRALNEPGLYPGDPLMQAMESYFSFFWPAMAWLARWVPIEPLFLGGHVLAHFFRFAALAVLARTLFPRERWAPALALWLVFFGHSGVGYETLNWNYFTHTPVATALGLWSLCAIFAGRWVLGLLLAGLVFDLQAMQSAYVLLMIGSAGLFELRRYWKQIAVGGALYLTAAAPGLWWMMSVSALEAPPDLMELIRAWFPFHFFPSSFAAHHWLAVAGFVLMWALTWRLESTPAVRRARWMCAGIFGFWLVGGVIMEVRPTSVWLKLHVFRSSAYLCLVLFALWGGLLAQAGRWALERGVRREALVGVLLLMALPGSYEFLELSDPALLGAGALAVAGLGCAVAGPRRLRAAGTALGFASAALAFALVWSARASVPGREPKPKWREVQEWARANTERSARFLVPPDQRGFRVFSERPIVGDVQDGSALLWSAEYADYWRQWYLDFGGAFDGADMTCWDRLARAWRGMDAAQLQELADQYDADFIVVRQRSGQQARTWSSAPVWENGAFAVHAAR